MPSRSYSDTANKARAKWSPQALEIATAFGNQLDAEVSGQMALGKDLATARSAAHLTQPQLAARTGLQRQISAVLNGDSVIPLGTRF